MSLTLHFHPLASFCWKALIALYENDIPFTPNLVDLGNPTEARRVAETVANREISGAARRCAERDRSGVQHHHRVSRRHYGGRTRFIPDDPDRALQTRLRDRFYDLYVHLPMQKIMGDRLRADAQAGSARRRGGTRAVADVLCDDRTADGARRLGDGRRFQSRRLRRRAVAVLRQHGGAVWRCAAKPHGIFRTTEDTSLVRARA